MELLELIILGIIQGITEPIPVSSSGHLLIFKTILENLFNGVTIDYATLIQITNIGSLVAITIIYWNEIITLIKSFFSYIFKKETRKKEEKNWKYCWLIVIASIPAGVFGLIASNIKLLEKLDNNMKCVGITLLITAIFLFLVRNIKGKKEKKDITIKDAIVVGLFQMIAVIPGISRSGSTLVGSMFRDLKRETAFDYAFILYIPVSLGTTILGIKDLLKLSISTTTLMFYLLSAVVAGVFTYLCLKWFKNIVKEGKLIYFSIYCLVVGLLVILFL